MLYQKGLRILKQDQGKTGHSGGGHGTPDASEQRQGKGHFCFRHGCEGDISFFTEEHGNIDGPRCSQARSMVALVNSGFKPFPRGGSSSPRMRLLYPLFKIGLIQEKKALLKRLLLSSGESSRSASGSLNTARGRKCSSTSSSEYPTHRARTTT